MLAGRVYRIFQRYADIHAAFDLPGGILRDASGAEIGRVEGIALRRNRLWLTGHARAARVEMRIARSTQSAAPTPDAEGRPAFALDMPVEAGPIEITAETGGAPVSLHLPGVTETRLRRARARQAVRFLRDLVLLLPEIYRWKRQGDLGARETVKERLGLVPRPDAQPLSAEVLLAAAPALPGSPVATLILPVHNAFDILPEALDRVARHSGGGWRLILVEDASTDARVRPFLETWSADPDRVDRVTLLCNDTNLGFVGAVNRAFEAARHWPGDPVVLLNSDVLVPEGWLPRLLAPLADPSVASVTPMSNDAEIFTLPAICQRTDLAPGTAEAIDAAASRLPPGAADAPTGVGFCMALAPQFLARVPQFDSVFGRGYGEENDWCQKTRALGGRHIGIGNLFVEHRGGASFGNAVKQRQLERNLAVIRRRYPRYDDAVQDFIRRDPLATARLALGLVWAGAEQAGPVPVYLGHAMGGGAEHDLARRVAGHLEAGGSAVVLRVGLRHRFQAELHTRHGVTRGTTDDPEVLAALIAHLPRRRIVYSCGVGDRDPVMLPDLLLRLADGGAHPVEVLMHDYFPVSPAYTLLGGNGVYRGVPRANGPLAADPAHTAPRPAGGRVPLADWQAAWGRLMAAAERVTVFSEASRRIVTETYPQAAAASEVIPHVLAQVPPRIPPGAATPPVIGVLGNIGLQKGAAVLQRLSRDLAQGGAARIVVIGHLDPDYRLAPPSAVHGAYELRDLPGLVARYGISAWFIPSVWPETFSFTTHEALATGLPILAFDLGAQGEAVARAVAAGAPGAVLPLPEDGRLDSARLLAALAPHPLPEPA